MCSLGKETGEQQTLISVTLLGKCAIQSVFVPFKRSNKYIHCLEKASR